MGVNAGFGKSQDRPSQVYLSLMKKSQEKSLFINSYGKFNHESGLYQISFDVTKEMEHLNGEYEMAIHVADYRAEKSIVWNLGAITIWFKEGQDEGSNAGLKPEYRPLNEIHFSLPPESPQISLAVKHSI